MNRYDRYKDSGIPWLGEVPEHWEIKTIKMVVKEHAGNGFPIELQGNNGDVPFLKVSDLNKGGKLLEDFANSVTKNIIYEMKWNIVPKFSLVTAKIGEALKKNHRKIISQDSIIDNNCIAFECLEIDLNYHYYLSLMIDFNWFENGGAVPSLSVQKYKNQKICIPSKKEQTAIAHYLDTKLGEIDALIGKQQTLLEKLAEQRTAVITHAVTKGLNPAASMKNSGVEWLGDVPAHWEVKRLKFSVRNISQKVESQTSDLRYFGLENIESFTGRLILNIELESEGIANKFQENDVLFGKLRPYLAKVHLATQNGLVSTETLVFRAKKAINPKFLFYFCVSKDFIDAVNGTTFGSKMPRANWEDIGNFKMLIPSLEEQAIIIDYLNQETAKIDRLCETVNQTIGRLKEYRTALITQAVTGKIKVTDE